MSAKAAVSMVALLALLPGCLGGEGRPDREYWLLEVASDVREVPAYEGTGHLCGLYMLGPAAGVNHTGRQAVVQRGMHDIDWARTWIIVRNADLDVLDDDTNCDRDWRMFAAEEDFDWGWRADINHRIEESPSGRVRVDGEILHPGQPVVVAVDAWQDRGSRSQHLVGTLTFTVHGPWRMRDVLEVDPAPWPQHLDGLAEAGGDWVSGLP